VFVRGASGVAVSVDGFGLVSEIQQFLSLSFPRRKRVGLLRVFIAGRVQRGPCRGLPPSQCIHQHCRALNILIFSKICLSKQIMETHMYFNSNNHLFAN